MPPWCDPWQTAAQIDILVSDNTSTEGIPSASYRPSNNMAPVRTEQCLTKAFAYITPKHQLNPPTHTLSLVTSISIFLKKKEGGGRWRLQKETPYMWGGELLTDTGVVKNLSWLHGKTQGQRLPFPVCLNAWLCWERCLLLSEEDVWQLLRPGHDLGKILSSHHSSCAQDCLYLSTHKLQPIAFKCFIQLLLHIHPSQDKKTILTIRQNPYHKESSSNEMFWWWVYYKHHSCH